MRDYSIEESGSEPIAASALSRRGGFSGLPRDIVGTPSLVPLRAPRATHAGQRGRGRGLPPRLFASNKANSARAMRRASVLWIESYDESGSPRALTKQSQISVAQGQASLPVLPVEPGAPNKANLLSLIGTGDGWRGRKPWCCSAEFCETKPIAAEGG